MARRHRAVRPGRRQYLWRAVDEDGDLIDILVQSRRDRHAARRFFRKLLKRQGREPPRLITELRSYSAAHRGRARDRRTVVRHVVRSVLRGPEDRRQETKATAIVRHSRAISTSTVNGPWPPAPHEPRSSGAASDTAARPRCTRDEPGFCRDGERWRADTGRTLTPVSRRERGRPGAAQRRPGLARRRRD